MPKAKPVRTELFVPGNKEDWMRKAPKYGADALILDLEDSVPRRTSPTPAYWLAGWCENWERPARRWWSG